MFNFPACGIWLFSLMRSMLLLTKSWRHAYYKVHFVIFTLVTAKGITCCLLKMIYFYTPSEQKAKRDKRSMEDVEWTLPRKSLGKLTAICDIMVCAWYNLYYVEYSCLDTSMDVKGEFHLTCICVLQFADIARTNQISHPWQRSCNFLASARVCMEGMWLQLGNASQVGSWKKCNMKEYCR